jgi:hypothetical protein
MKKVLGALLVLIVLSSFLVVFIPVYLIRPFAPQTASDLDVSYSLRSASPLLTMAALVLSLLCAFPLWKSATGWLRKSCVAIAGVLLTALAILARQNHFEWMFHPLPQAGYVEVVKASHVSDGDMVLSLEIHGEARAYPVPLLAYHHLVNTTVGGEPIVVTY